MRTRAHLDESLIELAPAQRATLAQLAHLVLGHAFSQARGGAPLRALNIEARCSADASQARLALTLRGLAGDLRERSCALLDAARDLAKSHAGQLTCKTSPDPEPTAIITAWVPIPPA